MLMILESAALAAYVFAAWHLRGRTSNGHDALLTLVVALAILLQALALGSHLNFAQEWRLGIGQAINLFLWQCCVLHLLLCLRLPLWHLGQWLWPAAAIAIPLAWWLPAGAGHATPLSPALKLHILLSLLAYASLTLAALQTVSYALLDRSLRSGEHRPQGPPLQLMEDMVFRLVILGFLLLIASIASGFLFVDDFFAQHLAHKTILSIVACALFGGLIGGRLLWGWRGRTAIRWTLSAYVSLLLAYFGSKLVLEQILGSSWT